MKKTKSNSALWLYGHHVVVAALQNPNREKILLKMTKESVLPEKIVGRTNAQIVSRQEIDSLSGQNAVHQGLALQVKPLPPKTLDEILENIPNKAVILILDQVTDPHNIGAILRSAAAFDASAVIIPDACAPEESAVLAKSACGALEIVPLVRVTNLVRTMQQLKNAGFWCLGLDGYAKEYISDKKLPARTAFILGSEGDGMRRLTAENCDYTIKLPISDRMESLNVSNAAAVALYEFYRQK